MPQCSHLYSGTGTPSEFCVGQLKFEPRWVLASRYSAWLPLTQTVSPTSLSSEAWAAAWGVAEVGFPGTLCILTPPHREVIVGSGGPRQVLLLSGPVYSSVKWSCRYCTRLGS